MIALCGAGAMVVGVVGSRTRSQSTDQRFENLKLMNARMKESMRSLQALPKFDYKLLDFQPRPLRGVDLSAPYVDTDLSPSQRRATSSP